MISILVPTKNRPQNIIRLSHNIFNTMSGENLIEIYFYVDFDDGLSVPAINELQSIYKNIKYIQSHHIILSNTVNILSSLSPGPYYMNGADDILFRTKNWDLLIIDAFSEWEDKIGIVHGRDGIHSGGLATHSFFHKNWINTLGYLCPPYFAVDMADRWNSEIAGAVKRKKYLEELYIEHMHPNVKKSERDETYNMANIHRKRKIFKTIYDDLKSLKMNDIEKLKNIIYEL